jgi:hypothetical protein
MKRRPWTALAVLAVLLGLGATPPAHAGAIGLLAQTGLISGRQSFVFSMQVDSPGSLEVALTDLNWQGRLADLTFSVSGKDGLLGESQSFAQSLTGNNTVIGSSIKLFTITSPGTYYAFVSGSALGPYAIGLYSLNASFTSAVPLPAAGLLLLSGLGGMAAAIGRRRNARRPAVAVDRVELSGS